MLIIYVPSPLIHRSLYKHCPRVNSFIQQITVLSTSGSGLGAGNKVADKTDLDCASYGTYRQKSSKNTNKCRVTNF